MKKIENLSVLVECSQGIVPKVETLKKFVDCISQMGYSSLYLGLADAYKIAEEPFFNYKRGGYTKQDLNEIDCYARGKGVEVVANIQTLSHLHFLRKYPVYTDIFDTSSNLMVGEPRVYELIDHMIKAISEGLSSRKIHLGFDEAFGLGTGNYLKKHGPADKKQLLLEHLQKVAKICEKYGMQIEIWGDMLTESDNTAVTPQQVKKALPQGTKVFLWDYTESDKKKLDRMISDMKKHADDMAFAGCIWKHIGFAPNLEYSLRSILPQIDACAKNGVSQYMITLWADQAAPCSIFSSLPALFAAAEYADGNFDGKRGLNKQKFADICGIAYDDMYSLEYVNYPLMKKHNSPSTSAFWVFFTDVLLGNFDLFIDDGSEKGYKKLARKYARLSKGNFGNIFEKSAQLMKVLAIKAPLCKRLRKAYEQKNKAELLLVAKELQKLAAEVNKFIRVYEKCFLQDNRAFGLELHHYDFGGVAQRADYAKRRILDFVRCGTPIEELEGGVLPLEFVPPVTISNSCMTDYHYVISYCLE